MVCDIIRVKDESGTDRLNRVHGFVRINQRNEVELILAIEEVCFMEAVLGPNMVNLQAVTWDAQANEDHRFSSFRGDFCLHRPANYWCLYQVFIPCQKSKDAANVPATVLGSSDSWLRMS